MKEIIIPCITAILGFLSGLLMPVVKWEIEKRQKLRKRRIELIEECKVSISEEGFSRKEFLHSKIYSELRIHLPENMVHRIESKRGILNLTSSRPNTFENTILDELAELEKKWSLI